MSKPVRFDTTHLPDIPGELGRTMRTIEGLLRKHELELYGLVVQSQDGIGVIRAPGVSEEFTRAIVQGLDAAGLTRKRPVS